jgi:two-component system, LytTR family, sensor kinase
MPPFDAIRNTLRFNVAFWLGYFVYEWLANASVGNEYSRYLINAAVLVPITMLAAIVTIHVCIKQFYFRDKKIGFWVLLVVSMIVFILARRSFNYYYTYPLYFKEALEYPFLFLPKLIIEGVSIYLVVSLYAIYYFVRAWYEQQQITQQLVQKKTEAELQMLKSQVQPHFIFNTLNNIYSYAIQKNDNVPDLIHRLASFLSYNLYDTGSAFIPLSKELEYIKSYIALEKLRYGDRLDVSLNVYDSVSKVEISPLLLLPLIENCFKHGFVSTFSECWIRIDVNFQNGWLTFKIENSIGDMPAEEKDYRNGIGLENVKKRLAIIYPARHEFRNIREENSFLTILKLKPH